MRNISDTIRRLRALQPPMPQGRAARHSDRLTDMPAFGTNPGMLRARIYVPAELPDNAPLVVGYRSALRRCEHRHAAAGKLMQLAALAARQRLIVDCGRLGRRLG